MTVSDIVTYSCGFSVEKNYYDVYLLDGGEELLVRTFLKKREAVEWIDNEVEYRLVKRIEVEPLDHALQAVRSKVHDILSSVGATDYVTYLTGSSNFRDEVAVTKPYKGNRDKTLKPIHYKEIREYLLNHHNGVMVEGMEADDAMAMEQMREYAPSSIEFPSVIICTIDKDLDQIPGWHYNWSRKEKYWIDDYKGLYNFYYQMLVGDAVDNITGVRGCGPKTAEKILRDCKTEKDMFSVVWREYENEYEDQAETIMQEMSDLLYIRKYPDERYIVENFKSNSRRDNGAKVLNPSV